MTHQIDQIYSQSLDKVSDFQFDSKVVGVFPDMIKRSVPGYSQIIHGIGQIATKTVQENSHVYDLGCSLAAASLAIGRHVTNIPFKIKAIDFSQDMVNRAKEQISAYNLNPSIDIIYQDIRETEIENASLVILNFTMQFLKPEDRQTLVNKIYQGLNPGGALIVSEKLSFNSATVGKLIDDLHLDFKRANGYSELEISQKRSALENVMKPDTLETHLNRLKEAGFEHKSVWLQTLNFASMVAIK
ncbi:carboxy-S-adenosyl-L-methionine synthase CmoA [Paraferrimonas sp. SM1919]|uniref:carboxy-S-adenosyl-L-methionine synthase CmoA n=1 Tax=Paraferrimonas sp. SM1919 TaxID=2662263 RepID=UPI0013D12BC1|nr:carboxy-S-adenosyl-L-methionine synthase CmoA [Paraferrimonas sp. SM1919]